MNSVVTLKTQFGKASVFSVPNFCESVHQVHTKKYLLFAILAFC